MDGVHVWGEVFGETSQRPCRFLILLTLTVFVLSYRDFSSLFVYHARLSSLLQLTELCAISFRGVNYLSMTISWGGSFCSYTHLHYIGWRGGFVRALGGGAGFHSVSQLLRRYSVPDIALGSQSADEQSVRRPRRPRPLACWRAGSSVCALFFFCRFSSGAAILPSLLEMLCHTHTHTAKTAAPPPWYYTCVHTTSRLSSLRPPPRDVRPSVRPPSPAPAPAPGRPQRVGIISGGARLHTYTCIRRAGGGWMGWDG